jgi:hypothetical protein
LICASKPSSHQQSSWPSRRPRSAQDDYTEFVNKEDFFTITFPGKPVITDGTWLTEYFVNLPAKILHD